MDVIEKLAAAGYLSKDQVARVRGNVSTFMGEVDSNPEFASDALEKAAGFGDFGKKVLTEVDPAKTVGAVIASGIMMGAIAGGQDIYDAIKGKIHHRSSFNEMMDMSPKLKKHDKKMVSAAFNTLHRFNPEYASDPLVAGTFVQNALDMSRVDVGTVNSLVDASAKMNRDTGMSMTDAMKFVQFKEGPPQAHASQVKAWESQANRKELGPHAAQIAAWRAQAAQSDAKTTGAHRTNQAKILASRTEAKANLAQGRQARAQLGTLQAQKVKAEAEADFLRAMANKAQRMP